MSHECDILSFTRVCPASGALSRSSHDCGKTVGAWARCRSVTGVSWLTAPDYENGTHGIGVLSLKA